MAVGLAGGAGSIHQVAGGGRIGQNKPAGHTMAAKQPKIAHVAPTFQAKPQQAGEIFEAAGKKDSMDNEFEEY